jgi:hypothetical protein
LVAVLFILKILVAYIINSHRCKEKMLC